MAKTQPRSAKRSTHPRRRAARPSKAITGLRPAVVAQESDRSPRAPVPCADGDGRGLFGAVVLSSLLWLGLLYPVM
jgi:hypothetical protein